METCSHHSDNRGNKNKMTCPRKRPTTAQETLRLLHRIHRKTSAILAIVANPVDTDFTKEDAIVRHMTKKVKEARKRIPSIGETTNKEQ